MNLAEWIQALWPILAAAGGLGVWLVRLEMKQREMNGKVEGLADFAKNCSAQQELCRKQIGEKLAAISNSQARMEGIMSVIHKNLNGGSKDAETT